jgi:hypothetical protein
MTPLLTAGLLSVSLVLTAPADDPTAEQPVEEQPTAEEGAAEAAPEGEPAAPAEPVGYEATVELTNGSVLRGRIVDESLEGITIVLEGMTAAPVVVARSSIARVLMGADAEIAPPATVVVEAPVVAEAPAEPPPTPAEVGRGIGFGFNFGLGLGYGDTTNLVPDTEGGSGAHFDIELPGFELRLFPDDRFSLDFLFKFGSAAALQGPSNYGWYYGVNEIEVMLFSLYFHFHTPSKALGENSAVNLAIAPGVALGGARWYGSPWWGQIGASMRIGADFTSADGVMGFGVYARPGISMLVFDGYSEPSNAAEVLLEFTWTWYTPRAPGM